MRIEYIGDPGAVHLDDGGQLVGDGETEEGGSVLYAGEKVLELEGEVAFEELGEEVVEGEVLVEQVERGAGEGLCDLVQAELSVVLPQDYVHEGGHQGSQLVLQGLHVQQRAVQQLHHLSVTTQPSAYR